MYSVDARSRVFLKEQNGKRLDGELEVNFVSQQLLVSKEKLQRMQS